MPRSVVQTKSDYGAMRVAPVAAPLRKQIVDVLRSAITSGQLAPGQRLVERELCEVIGVSRPSLREAMRQLESEQLVVVLPNRGISVARLKEDDVRSIYQVRASLEALAASLFAINATDEELAELVRSKTRLCALYERGNIAGILEEKRRFYELLLDGSRNTIIRSILTSLSDRITSLRRVTLGTAERCKASRNEIEAVVAAIVRRDASAAFRAMEAHVEMATIAAVRSISTINQLEESAAP